MRLLFKILERGDVVVLDDLSLLLLGTLFYIAPVPNYNWHNMKDDLERMHEWFYSAVLLNVRQ